MNGDAVGATDFKWSIVIGSQQLDLGFISCLHFDSQLD